MVSTRVLMRHLLFLFFFSFMQCSCLCAVPRKRVRVLVSAPVYSYGNPEGRPPPALFYRHRQNFQIFSEWRAFSDISPVIPNPRFRATLTNANAARRCCTIAWWCLWCKMVLSLWWSPVRPTRTLTRWWCSRSSGWLLGFWSVPCHWTREFFLAKKSSWSSLRVPFGESKSCFWGVLWTDLTRTPSGCRRVSSRFCGCSSEKASLCRCL